MYIFCRFVLRPPTIFCSPFTFRSCKCISQLRFVWTKVWDFLHPFHLKCNEALICWQYYRASVRFPLQSIYWLYYFFVRRVNWSIRIRIVCTLDIAIPWQILSGVFYSVSLFIFSFFFCCFFGCLVAIRKRVQRKEHFLFLCVILCVCVCARVYLCSLSFRTK